MVGFNWKKFWNHLLYTDIVSFFVTRKYQEIQKRQKSVNIEEENLHIFWINCKISKKNSGKV